MLGNVLALFVMSSRERDDRRPRTARAATANFPAPGRKSNIKRPISNVALHRIFLYLLVGRA